MSYFVDNWGSFIGLLSLIITVIGFTVAIHRAGQARKSAEAAEAASRETQEAIAGILTVADLQRAIAMIQRLKDLHRNSKWEISLQHYQPLRVMLADIHTRHPTLTPDQRAILHEAIPQIALIENNVDEALREGTEPSVASNFHEMLNIIQMDLERIASSMNVAGSDPGGRDG